MSRWIRLLFLVILCFNIRCSSGRVESAEIPVVTMTPTCTVSAVRAPTTPEEFQNLYAGRGFYADGNHLGRDIRLTEGTPIHPIACGTVRIYRPANGYGTLAVVIEHQLPHSLNVTNGMGELVSVTNFLSIYGHLRTTSSRNGGTVLGVRVGDRVGPDDVIGFVQNDAENGDGAEHLHLGIRLQSSGDAQRTELNWFRGYDTTPSQRRFFADPQSFLPTLMRAQAPVRWHPPGTVMVSSTDPSRFWVLDEADVIHGMDASALHRERLEEMVVRVDPEEIACYAVGAPYHSFLTTDDVHVYRFGTLPTVYEINLTRREMWAFVDYHAFQSWGWRDEDVLHDRATPEFAAFSDRLIYQGMRQMREGSLVKGTHQSEVSVVSSDRRLPIADWQTFLSLGYRNDRIVEIDDTVLDAVAFPRGPLITAEATTTCQHPALCLNGRCDAGRTGGGIGDELDGGAGGFLDRMEPLGADVTTVPDVAMREDQQVVSVAETCNGLDDDGNGRVDEIFMCPLNTRGSSCITLCGSNGLRRCMAPRCEWSALCEPYSETCDNTIDDDCNGLVDCADPACLVHTSCRSLPPMDGGASPLDVISSPDVSVSDVMQDRSVTDLPEAAMVRSDAVDEPRIPMGVRYEFRVLPSAGWSATSPFRLRDRWWTPMVCLNTGTATPQSMADGWQRCEVGYPVSPFVGSFFSPAHPDWGDRGQLGTVGNAPERCTPTEGVEWRIQELPSERVLFQGPASELPCMSVGSQDRHILP